MKKLSKTVTKGGSDEDRLRVIEAGLRCETDFITNPREESKNENFKILTGHSREKKACRRIWCNYEKTATDDIDQEQDL